MGTPLTSENALRTAAAAAGYQCSSFVAEARDTMNNPWDGPWITGTPSVCGYHTGPVWQGQCDLKPPCGYSRICPCKFVKGLKKPTTGKKRRGKKKSTSPSPEMAAAMAKCPHVRLLDSWADTPDECVLEKSFGCGADASKMWTEKRCSGI